MASRALVRGAMWGGGSLILLLYGFYAFQSRPALIRTGTKPCHGLADCTQLIESGKLSGLDLSDAYYERSVAQPPGDVAATIADASKAIELDPGNSWALSLRGNAYALVKEYNHAIEDLTKAIDIANANHARNLKGAWDQLPYFYRTRRSIYEMMGKYDLAIADATKGIEWFAHPENTLTQPGIITRLILSRDLFDTSKREASETGYRAELYLTIGRRDEAIADYRRAFRLNPGEPYYVQRLTSLGADP